MRIKILAVFIIGSTLAVTGAIAQSQVTPPGTGSDPLSGQPGGMRGGRGMGGFPGGGRGILGSVTEVAADHYTIKTDAGESYIVHFSVNTRIIKQQPGPRQPGGGQSGLGVQGGNRERPTPQEIKPTDIKVGDFVTAAGEVDTSAKSVGAMFIIQLDPERAKQMREMQANFGKTWLAGRITAIDGTNITIEGISDHAPHIIAVDENTSFHSRRDSITLADIHVGQQLRAEGAVKGSSFLATTVTAMENREPGERNRNRAPDSGAAPTPAGPQ